MASEMAAAILLMFWKCNKAAMLTAKRTRPLKLW